MELGGPETWHTLAGLLLDQLGPHEHTFSMVDAALRLVTSLAHATVPGADGVSVSLHRHGAMMTVAASDDRIAQMDRDQYATGEGPCLSAAATGEVIEVPSLRHEARWPDFVSRARHGGIASILASPLLAAAGPVGSLNMYSRTEGSFGDEARSLSSLYAEQASGILIEAADRPFGEGVEARLVGALRTRARIAQAQGIVMARTGDSPERAYARLKLDARTSERSLRDVCAATIADATASPGDRTSGG